MTKEKLSNVLKKFTHMSGRNFNPKDYHDRINIHIFANTMNLIGIKTYYIFEWSSRYPFSRELHSDIFEMMLDDIKNNKYINQTNPNINHGMG